MQKNNDFKEYANLLNRTRNLEENEAVKTIEERKNYRHLYLVLS